MNAYLKSFAAFADLLRACNVVHEDAVYDSFGYDGGVTMDRMADAHQRLVEESRNEIRNLHGLKVFEIRSVRWDDDEHTTGKDWTTIITCKDIAAAWEWIESDRNDLRTEVRTIHMLGHCCAVIPSEPEERNKESFER